MDISKSVILITTAGTPTGRAIAEHFCALGARVVIVDADQNNLDKTVEACSGKSHCCYPFLLKDRDVSNINQIFDKIKHQLGGVDVLINYWQNHSLSLLKKQENIENTAADVTSNLYIFGRCAAANMMDKGEGVIINIPYILFKNQHEHELTNSNTVIRGLTLSWGQELEHTNIRVGGVLNSTCHHDITKSSAHSTINYEVIESIAYIVENDSFTSRVLEIY